MTISFSHIPRKCTHRREIPLLHIKTHSGVFRFFFFVFFFMASPMETYTFFSSFSLKSFLHVKSWLNSAASAIFMNAIKYVEVTFPVPVYIYLYIYIIYPLSGDADSFSEREISFQIPALFIFWERSSTTFCRKDGVRGIHFLWRGFDTNRSQGVSVTFLYREYI